MVVPDGKGRSKTIPFNTEDESPNLVIKTAIGLFFPEGESDRMRLEMLASSNPRFPALRLLRCLVLFLLTFPLGSMRATVFEQEEEAPTKKAAAALVQKPRPKIAIIDSGLGGLSVVAESVKKVKESRVFESCEFIFFNALFSNEGGYNSLRTREEKILVFSSALESLERKFQPDIILIGCNTLSVLYEDTPFSRKTRVPVVGIIDSGVELIAAALREHPEASVVIFATPTTVSEGVYRERLLKLGCPDERIQTQSCPELESFIENNPQGEETGMLISAAVSEAVQKFPSPPSSLLASLNCTHYGYSLPLWEQALDEIGVKPWAILNPNSRLADVLVNKECPGRHPKTEVGVRAVSMVEISRRKIDALAPWLERISLETADALRRTEHDPFLFEWKKWVNR